MSRGEAVLDGLHQYGEVMIEDLCRHFSVQEGRNVVKCSYSACLSLC